MGYHTLESGERCLVANLLDDQWMNEKISEHLDVWNRVDLNPKVPAPFASRALVMNVLLDALAARGVSVNLLRERDMWRCDLSQDGIVVGIGFAAIMPRAVAAAMACHLGSKP